MHRAGADFEIVGLQDCAALGGPVVVEAEQEFLEGHSGDCDRTAPEENRRGRTETSERNYRFMLIKSWSISSTVLTTRVLA